MKAAYLTKTGAPEVIQWGELPIPSIKENEILVKVTAVAVNPVDTYIRSGKYPLNLNSETPYVIGLDMVGTVAKLGAHVTEFSPGQKVWSNNLGKNGRQGSFAEYVAVPEDLLYHAPKGCDDHSLVAVLTSGATASLGLIRDAMLKSTDTIFINGGGGSVAAAVIQLAKGRGARVLTSTTGKEKMDWCLQIGADRVFDYREGNIQDLIKTEAPNGIEVYWDTSPNPNFDFAVSLLGKKGRIILMAGSATRPAFPVGPFFSKECVMKGLSLFSADVRELRQCADMINLSIEKHQMKSKIAKVMSLSDVVKAHKMMESQPEMWGKIVLTVN